MSNQPIALVTGANKGIGFEIARQLGENGFTVWLGCRDGSRGANAATKMAESGIDARALLLDVTDTESLAAAATKVDAECGVLDVLVNSAGMHFGPPPPITEEPVDEMREIFDTNAFGPVRVTQAFLPLLRKASAARVVMMSSGLGSLSNTLDMRSENWTVGFAGYCASKTALNMFTVKLAKELAPLGIKVNAADPGLTSTDLTDHGPGHSPAEAAKTPVELALTEEFGPTAGFYVRDASGKLSLHPW